MIEKILLLRNYYKLSFNNNNDDDDESESDVLFLVKIIKRAD